MVSHIAAYYAKVYSTGELANKLMVSSTVAGEFRKRRSVSGRQVCRALLLVVALTLLFIAKDIAALTVNNAVSCHQRSSYVAFEVGFWLNTAAIVHLVGSGCVFCAFALWLVYRNFFRMIIGKLTGQSFTKSSCPVRQLWVTGVCICLLSLSFCAAWMVIGLLMYADIETTDHDALSCVNTMLAWCILQIVETFVVPCALVCSYFACLTLEPGGIIF